jgi:hypothetical protein
MKDQTNVAELCRGAPLFRAHAPGHPRASPLGQALILVAALLLLTHQTTSAQSKTPPRFSTPRPSEYVHIDGSRNPEMIPQWATWAFAFRVIAGGSRLIPTVVLGHLSEAEAAEVVKEATADQKRDAECQERVLRLRPLLLTERAAVINEKTREIQLECRWRTLRARDRLLARLRPEGQIALIQWVESTKSGMEVSVPKRELAHYQQPQ